MSLTELLWEWLTGPMYNRYVAATLKFRDARNRAAKWPVTWRAPRLRWQLLSWFATTLLAPPFWAIGILLMINPHSDQPLFWPSAMAVVAIANAVAIVDVNQRHHRRPFTSRLGVAVRYFGISLLTGCTLFLVVALNTGICRDFAALLGITGPTTAVLWILALAISFGILSFLHASLMHAWLGFETRY